SVFSFLNRSTSVDVCATVLSPALASEKPSSSANINSVATQAQIQIEESCQPLAATVVDSDRSDEKDKNRDQNICDQKIEQDACQSYPVDATIQQLKTLLLANERIHKNHYVKKNKDLSGPQEATESLSVEDAIVMGSLEIEMSPLVSNSGCEQHSSTVSETIIEEMPPTVLDHPIASAVQSDTAGIDQMLMNPVNTPTVDTMCLNTLAGKSRQRSFAPTRIQQLNGSQQGRNSSAEMRCKSLSVVVPHQPLQSSKLTRNAHYSGRSRFIPSAESDDDPGDSDYHEDSHAESRIEYDKPAASPVKRKRRINTSMNTSQLHGKRVQAQAFSKSSPLKLASPESTVQSSTSLETIRIRGQFLRKVSLSRVEYCCWVTEDINSAASTPVSSDIWASLKKVVDEGGQSTSMSDFQAINIEGLFTRDLTPCGYIWSFNFKEKHAKSPENHALPQGGRVSPTLDDLVVDSQTSSRAGECPSLKGKDYTAEEDALIVHLKENEKLSWPRIAARFSKRTQTALQVRYCTKLKGRPHQTQSGGLSRPRTGQAQTITVASPMNTQSSRRQYSLRKLRHSSNHDIPRNSYKIKNKRNQGLFRSSQCLHSLTLNLVNALGLIY
ncbi:hypothetical protein DPV78_011870, partial [Talaromyces pinophilus]